MTKASITQPASALRQICIGWHKSKGPLIHSFCRNNTVLAEPHSLLMLINRMLNIIVNTEADFSNYKSI
jgi:hypothetical protein